MKYFVIVFDTERAELLHIDSFEDPEQALRARFGYEGAHAAESAIEVAVLRAESEEAIRQTHPRYFADTKEEKEVSAVAL